MAPSAFNPSVELLYTKPIGEGWMEAQLGVDDVLCVPFQYHLSQVENMTQPELEQFLERQARAYISRYGDAREPKPEELVQAQEAQNVREMQEAYS